MSARDIHPVFGDLKKVRSNMLTFARREGCGSDAEDFVHLAIEEMLVQQVRFQDVGVTELAARWGCAILRFRIYNERNRVRNRIRLQREIHALADKAVFDDPQFKLLLADVLAYLRDDVRPEWRASLLLAAFGATTDEIAAINGRKKSVVKMDTCRARKSVTAWAA